MKSAAAVMMRAGVNRANNAHKVVKRGVVDDNAHTVDVSRFNLVRFAKNELGEGGDGANRA
jgi:hypothetical protein